MKRKARYASNCFNVGADEDRLLFGCTGNGVGALCVGTIVAGSAVFVAATAVDVKVGVKATVGVCVGTGVNVGVAVRVGVGEGETFGVTVAVGVGVGVCTNNVTW